MEIMEEQILALLGQKDYAPANVPEMLRLLQLPPNRQQELQGELRKLEQSGQITRTKGNRYIKSQEADLIPGQIQINRQGKGFLRPDDSGIKEIMIPENATSTALHGDRVLVRRDVRARGLRPERGAAQETGSVFVDLEGKLEPTSRHFDDVIHWNDAGGEAVARAIADGLVASGWQGQRAR